MHRLDVLSMSLSFPYQHSSNTTSVNHTFAIDWFAVWAVLLPATNESCCQWLTTILAQGQSAWDFPARFTCAKGGAEDDGTLLGPGPV